MTEDNAACNKSTGNPVNQQNKRQWQTPQLIQLKMNQTKGGFFKDTFEDPYDFLFGS